ncbi:hypothetical protein FIBSPDRAFT_865442 [Athelia psychrophila]|uniref:Uncharacterized protein n=1 Tax=Athelia psychrophila TaxID=1759441 RepID=A0A166FKR6_9AGAM|nr:hypothetical protein FIBSPDRAFT_865442 [Fibularhizoctonia sp. CBS 109695]
MWDTVGPMIAAGAWCPCLSAFRGLDFDRCCHACLRATFHSLLQPFVRFLDVSGCRVLCAPHSGEFYVLICQIALPAPHARLTKNQMPSHSSKSLFTDITNTLNDDMPASDASSEISEEDLGILRSPSRLGFSFAQSDGGCEGDLADAETRRKLRWTFGPFNTVGEDEHESENSPIQADISFSSSSSSELDDASSEDSGSDDEERAALFTMFPTTPVIPPPVPKRPTRPSPAPLLALSPLSPHYHHVPNSPSDPPKITHHGLSHSSLSHQKWLWQHRYDEWIAWEADMDDAESPNSGESAYGGIAMLPGTCGQKIMFPPRSPPPPAPSPPPPTPAPNSKIFPRMGDLSALRDPYSAAIDRCFCRFPLWTMQKALFMFDMHHRASALSEIHINDGDAHEIEEPEMDSPKHGSLINITITEVAPESDSPEPEANGELEPNGDLTLLSINDSDSDLTVFSPSNSCVSSAKTKCSSLPEDDEDSGDFHTSDGVRAWEINWYARWELLIELIKRDALSRHGNADSQFKPPAPRPDPGPRFFLAEEEEAEWDDEDDDEDYGAIVTNPIYGSGRSSIQVGFERAQEFFAIGNRNIDVRSGAKTLTPSL